MVGESVTIEGADLAPASPTRNLEAALWMIGSGVVFTAFLTLSKLQSATYDPGFLAFWRAAVGMILMVPIIINQGWLVMRIYQPWLILLRSLFGTLGFVFGFYAVSDAIGLPLSEFNAISFSRGLFITLLAVFLLKEKVGPHRWIATLVGFVGVIVMTQPQTGLSVGTLLALGAAFSLAGAITLVKSLSRLHRPMTLLIWANLLSTLLMLPLAILNWPEGGIGLSGCLWIGLMGLCGVVGQYMYIRAMSMGDASFLSPMDYLRLPFAATADWFIFHLLPGFWTWIGTGIIIGATLYITLREQAQRKKRAPETDAL